MQAKNTNGPQARAGCKNESRQPHSSNGCDESQCNPACLASERAILGAILEDDDLIMPDVIASGLASSDFSLLGHRRMFDSMVEQWREQKSIDAILITARLGNRVEDAVLVASAIQGVIVHPDHISEHIELVRNAARLRGLLRIAEWMTAAVEDTDNADALIEDAIQKLERISRPEVRA